MTDDHSDAWWLADQGVEPQPAPRYPKGSGTARRGSATLEGIARHVRLRSETIAGSMAVPQLSQSRQEQVLTFDLTVIDAQGNQHGSVPVELRSEQLHGQVVDGRRVRVKGTWRDGLLEAKEIVAVDGGARLSSRRRALLVRGLFLLPVAVVGIAAVSIIGFAGWRLFSLSSLEGTPAKMPDVRGLTATAATNKLHQAGFHNIQIEHVTDPGTSAGSVSLTAPPAGTPLTTGAPVTLYISDGNSLSGGALGGSTSGGSPTSGGGGGGTTSGGGVASGGAGGQSSSLVLVPSVKGLTPDDATSRLMSAGFHVDQPPQQQSDSSVPRGFVIDSNPAGGSSQPAHSRLTLIVSNGPNVIVPNVLGMKEQDATKVLQNDGFKVVVTRQPFQSGPGATAPGYVVDTNPTHDSLALAGSNVELVVVGPAPIPGATPTSSPTP